MYSLRRYDWTLHLATLVVCAFFLARAVTTYVAGMLESTSAVVAESAPKPAEGVTAEEAKESAGVEAYKVIEDRNIFNSAEVAAAPEEGTDEMNPQQLGELGPAVKTSLDVKVQSTLVIGEGTDRRSSAMVASGKSKGSQAFFVGDEESFAPNVKLTKIGKDRIEFVNAGRLEFAELVDWTAKKSVFASPDEVHGTGTKAADKGDAVKPEAASSAGGKVVLDQKEVDDALQNLDKLYSEVRIVPNFQDGKPDGMKVLSIKPGGFASKLGIRRGDVLKNVNGQELDIKRGMELFGSMKDSKNFSLDVVRGGKNQTLEYEIK